MSEKIRWLLAARNQLRGRPTVHVGLIENDVRSHVCWPGGQHLLLAHHEVGSIKACQFKTVAVRDGVGRTRFHAVSAENAAVIVDVVDLGVALGAADAIFRSVFCGLDVNAVGWAGRRAQETRDALFQAILIPLQYVRSAKASLQARSAQRAFTVRVVLDDCRIEHLPKGDAHPLGDGRDILQHRHTHLVYRMAEVASRAARKPRATAGILSMMNQPSESESARVGLCVNCRWMRRMHSDRGSTFYLCERSATDPNFPKYPRLPVVQCAGFEAKKEMDDDR